MTFDKYRAEEASEHDQEFLTQLADRLNRKQKELAKRGWRGEGIYQWLCLITGRYLRRYRPEQPTDPKWVVIGWGIGRDLDGPVIYYDVTQGRVRVDRRGGAEAWKRENRI